MSKNTDIPNLSEQNMHKQEGEEQNFQSNQVDMELDAPNHEMDNEEFPNDFENYSTDEQNNKVDEEINELREQIDTLQDKLLRSMAEAENIRTRSSKLIEEAKLFSINNFAKDLIPVNDNLSRALEHSPEQMDQATKQLFEGVQMTKNELDNVFTKNGLDCINPRPGDKFDYNYHNAISQLVTDEFEEGTIVSTMQVGYKIKSRLLRPAAVVVAKK